MLAASMMFLFGILIFLIGFSNVTLTIVRILFKIGVVIVVFMMFLLGFAILVG